MAPGRRVALLPSGTRGDIQPFVGLAQCLRERGFQVLTLTNSNHVEFVANFGLDVVGTGMDYESTLAEPIYRQAHTTGDYRTAHEMSGRRLARELPGILQKEREALESFHPDLLVVTVLSREAGCFYSTLLKVPAVTLSLQPVTDEEKSQELFGQFAQARFLHLPIIHKLFGHQLGGFLWPTFESFLLDAEWPIGPELVAWSPELCRPPASKREWQKVVGFVHVTKQEEQGRERSDGNFGGGKSLEAMERFLRQERSKPVYIGWGSMSAQPQQMACLAVRSLMQAGLRGIVVGGWAGLKAEMVAGQRDQAQLEAFMSRSVLFVPSAPHEWLFPRCSVLVHHGGAGTCCAALHAGVPSVITPFFVDQPENARIIKAAGLGVAMDFYRTVTPEQLAGALRLCAGDRGMQARCRAIAQKLGAERGAHRAVDELEAFLAGDVASGAWRRAFDERCRWRVGQEVPTTRDFLYAFRPPDTRMMRAIADAWESLCEATSAGGAAEGPAKGGGGALLRGLPAPLGSELKWMVWNETWRAANFGRSADSLGEESAKRLQQALEDARRSFKHFQTVLQSGVLSQASLLRLKRRARCAGEAAAAEADELEGERRRGVDEEEDAAEAEVSPPEELAPALWDGLVEAVRLAGRAVRSLARDSGFIDGRSLQFDFEAAWHALYEPRRELTPHEDNRSKPPALPEPVLPTLSEAETGRLRSRLFLGPLRGVSARSLQVACDGLERFERRHGVGRHMDELRNSHLTLPWLQGLACDRALLGAAASALASDAVLLYSSRIVLSPGPGEAHPGPPEQDGRDLSAAVGPADEMVTAFVALAPCKRGEGCLEHIVDHDAARNHFPPGLPMELEAGEFCLYSTKAVHRTGPNYGRQRRRGVLLWYCSAALRDRLAETREREPRDVAVLLSGCDRNGYLRLVPGPKEERGRQELQRWAELSELRRKRYGKPL